MKRWSARSIRARKPPHSEFDAVARKFAPGFDLGHVGGLWIPAKDLARLFARLLARQCESLAAKGIAGARLERFRRVARDIGGTAAVTHDNPVLANVVRNGPRSESASAASPRCGSCRV